jgi:hypothetical protein
VQEFTRGENAVCILSVYACFSAALSADSHIERLIALSAQLIKSDILANLNAAFNLYAHCADDINFSVNNFFFKLIFRDTVAQHTARLLILFKYGYVKITLFGKIERTGKTCGPAPMMATFSSKPAGRSNTPSTVILGITFWGLSELRYPYRGAQGIS